MAASRREFLAGAGLLGTLPVLAAAKNVPLPQGGVSKQAVDAVVRFGVVSDLHYANAGDDKAPRNVGGQRFYRESNRKLAEAVRVFNARKLDFVIELGDFKDMSRNRDETVRYLEELERTFAGFRGPRYHVFGNHDFDCLTPEELAPRLLNDGQPMVRGNYSFAKGGITFIVLDGCYDSRLRHYSRNNPADDSNLPPEQKEWLRAELAAAPGPAVVFCHQRLDPYTGQGHRVKNGTEICKVLEQSGKVKAVFTGHQHLGAISSIKNILYYSIVAMALDSGPRANSFAEVAVLADGSVRVTGYLNAVSYGSPKGDIAV